MYASPARSHWPTEQRYHLHSAKKQGGRVYIINLVILTGLHASSGPSPRLSP